MKIIYDKVSSGYLYPLSKSDVNKVKNVVSVEDINKIRTIEFGCNIKTTQEGRTVQKGKLYDIRINFCLKNFNSLVLSDDKKYIDQIKSFSGMVDKESRLITWKLADAKRYVLFLLFHEIGHVIYSEHYAKNKLSGPTSKIEEQWCDGYAMQKIQELGIYRGRT
jgi:mRNA-degrading endonuclease RelE of RelBE toxin-antitoxin system